MGKDAESLGEILGRSLVKPARRSRAQIARAKRKWVSVVGQDLAGHTSPRSVRRGVLTVEVDSSALLAELAGYRRDEIITGLSSGEDSIGIRAVKFVLAEDQK